MPRRSLGRASLVLLGGTWIHSALSLAISVLIGRALGPAAVGALALNLGLAGLAMAALLPGFGQAHLKRVSEGQDAGRCLGTMLAIQAALSGGLGLVLLVAARLGALSLVADDRAVFVLMLGAQLAGRFADAFLKVLVARERVATHGAVLVAARLLRLAATVLVLTTAPRLSWVAATFLLEGVLTGAGAAVVLAADGVRPRRPTRASLTDYWRYARPFLVTTPLALVQDSIDRVLVGRWAGLTAAGYYHVARGLWEALTGVMAPPGLLLFTRLSALYTDRSEARDRAARQTFENGLDRLLFVSAPLAVALWAAAPLVLEQFYGASFLPATTTLRILVLAAFAMNVVNPYGYLFLALEDMAWLIPVNTARLVVYVTVLWLLVPPGTGWLPREAAGAAVARVVAVVALAWLYFPRTRALAGIGFYRPAWAYAASLGVGVLAFHAAERVLRLALPATPVLEIPAVLLALLAYLVALDQLHAPTRAHLARSLALFSPRQMLHFLRERP